MPKIIISYRRADSDAIAGRIRDRLAKHYGEDSIFMDIDNIPLGTDFRAHIRAALFDSDILVAVVGPKWLGLGKTSSRIKAETDPVRMEVETALKRAIPVIPVLVNGGKMPKPSDLPDSLTDFAYRNAAEVDAGRDFHSHMDRVIRSMDRVLQSTTATSPPGSVTSVADALPADALRASSVSSAVPEPQPTDQTAKPPLEPPSARPEIPMAAAAAAPTNLTSEAIASSEFPIVKAARRRWPTALASGVCAVLAALAAGAAIWFYIGRAPRETPLPVEQSDSPSQVAVAPAPPVASATPVDATAGCEKAATPSFHDDFKTADPGWDLGSQNEAYYADGQLVIKAEADASLGLIYRSQLYKNAIICLDVKSPPAMDVRDAGGGVIFWAADYQNYYVVLVYADGSFRITRKINGTWWMVSSAVRSEFIKQGFGVVNRIRIATVGNVAALYVNDRKIQDIKGQPPKAGGSVGVFGESEKGQANEWRYLDISVVKLPESQTVTRVPSEATTNAMLEACKIASAPAFADDFKVPDPSWSGLSDDKAYYADGQLKIKASANRIWEAVYWGMVYKDAIICADVKAPHAIKTAHDTAGGLLFWATGTSNYYVAAVYPDGSYAISRRVEGSIEKTVPKTNLAAINKGPDAENRIKIVLNNNVATLYINDVKAADFRGQAPPDGSAVGLFGESETDQRDEWGYLNIVVAEP